MLAPRAQRKAEGRDVVVGLVETHGRTRDRGAARGLESCRASRSTTATSILQEFDLDAALARKPALLLVDELAHTNVARLPPPQALAGRRGAARRRHRRLDDAQRPASREPERHRRQHHRRRGARDRARHASSTRPTRSCWSTSARRAAASACRKARSMCRTGRRARRERFFKPGQPDGAARAGAAPHRRAQSTPI